MKANGTSILVLALVAITAQTWCANRDFPAEIRACIAREDYLGGIRIAAEYEQELLTQYKAPTFEMGLFQSEAAHISFHNPFDGWREVSPEELDIPKEIVMTGFVPLLLLEDPTAGKRVAVFLINGKQLERRTGVADQMPSFDSEVGLQLLAQMTSELFGVAKGSAATTIGDHRVLSVEIAPPVYGTAGRMVLLARDGLVFSFVLVSTATDMSACNAKLEDLIKTASFDHKPADLAAINEHRDDCDRQDIASVLKCAENLARLGEYNAAAEDLADLRLLFYQRLPQACVNGDTGAIPAYGVRLKNPDADKWNLTAETAGAMQMVLIEDKYSVYGEGLIVMAVDTNIMYGPQLDEMLGSEEQERDSLIGAGRGGTMILGQIERERFTKIKNSLAYEAIVTPNMPGLKGRSLVLKRPGHLLVIMSLVNASEFELKLAEHDRILDDCLQVGETSLTRNVRQ
ncbi:MAG TPA: hypothetical protein PKL84_01525 [Candidatus Hydrogenedentes bacterium]|nr:hypothetical protein [Candidatus Hydrogenedentota bacterium]